jgi:predicted MFS family arabinose efflux permease
VIPGRTATSSPAPAVRLRRARFACPRSRSLLVGGLVIGLAASLYWTFAVDFLQTSGAVSTAGARGLLAVAGIASIAGTLAGDLVQRLGASTTFRLMILGQAASLVLLAAAPSSLALAAASAVLFGVSYNVVVAVQGIWSAAVFAERPSAGLAAVMISLSSGLLVGPPIAGLIADRTGFEAVFVAAGVLLIGTVALAPRERLDRPLRTRSRSDATV